MSEEKKNSRLDAFLKQNAPAVPRAPKGEKQRIWSEIEKLDTPWWARIISLPQFKFALPVAAALVLVVVVVHQKKLKRDRHIEQVLRSALVYQMEDGEEEGPI